MDRFERSPDSREPLPLPIGVSCYAVAATTSFEAGAVKDALVGDGLVPLKSALGLHHEISHCISFSAENQWTLYGANHIDLLKNVSVTTHLQTWLGN